MKQFCNTGIIVSFHTYRNERGGHYLNHRNQKLLLEYLYRRSHFVRPAKASRATSRNLTGISSTCEAIIYHSFSCFSSAIRRYLAKCLARSRPFVYKNCGPDSQPRHNMATLRSNCDSLCKVPICCVALIPGYNSSRKTARSFCTLFCSTSEIIQLDACSEGKMTSIERY